MTGGGWESIESMLAEFDEPLSVLEGCEVLWAQYDMDGWSGSAFILYRKGEQLFEVHGGHCSCSGLEGQWGPEETSVQAIKMRPDLDSELVAILSTL